ncbi:DUF6343 family protein [Streptomyces sp. ODS28]|uniref:DUF6343 family protein n=1 Tax=Streptomyces sp. ODS28 TaxID=3136688 RepID=UPI0031EC2A44
MKGPIRGVRSGGEPVTARSDLRLRYVLGVIFVPLFALGTLLLWYWSARAGPHTAPSDGSLRALALICAGLTVFAAVDLVVVVRRIRREARGGHTETPRPRR